MNTLLKYIALLSEKAQNYKIIIMFRAINIHLFRENIIM